VEKQTEFKGVFHTVDTQNDIITEYHVLPTDDDPPS